MKIFRNCLLCSLPLVPSFLIWARPSNDPATGEPGTSQSGKSFDEVVALILRYLNTGLVSGHDITLVHKASTTQGICQYLSSEYPKKNILIYQNQSSSFDGVNNIHRSIKFPQYTASGSDVYELEVFDSGTFELVGEGGYHNWAFCGSDWDQKGRSVVFQPHLDLSVDVPQVEWQQMRTSSISPAKMGGGYFAIPGDITGQDFRKIGPRQGAEGQGQWDAVYDSEDERWYTYYDPASPEAEIQSAEAIIVDLDGAVVEAAEVSLLDGPVGVIVAIAIIAAVIIISALLPLVGAILALFKQHSTERIFTQATVMHQASATPAHNVVIYHNQDGTAVLTDWVHYHYELPLGGLGKTQGYEMYVFRFGTFTNAGDGGFENWAFMGNWHREEHSAYVQFFPRNVLRRSLLQRAQSETGKPVRRRSLAVPQVPVRENPETKDGYYFVNCIKPDNTLSLGIAYYEEILPWGGNMDQHPDDFAEVLANHAGMQVWQGEGDVTFANSNTLFHWSFIHHGWKSGEPVTAGVAENHFEQLWIYREAGEYLFHTAANWTCNSLYYAF